jgi:histone H3/H4
LTDDRKHWAEVQRLLRDAVQDLSPGLDAKAVGAITEYLDHNELELALRSIQIAANEQNISISPVALERIKRAASLMRIDL